MEFYVIARNVGTLISNNLRISGSCACLQIGTLVKTSSYCHHNYQLASCANSHFVSVANGQILIFEALVLAIDVVPWKGHLY